MSVSAPDRMCGQPWTCGSVGPSGNRRRNHAATAGWNPASPSDGRVSSSTSISAKSSTTAIVPRRCDILGAGAGSHENNAGVKTVTETRPTADVPEVDDVEDVEREEPRSGFRRDRALVVVHAVVSAVLTWPLVAHLTDRLPYGTEDNPTVQLFNLWTLRWNQDRIGHLFAHYWDAPIFHPTGGAFALSEPQPLTGLVFAPISWLSGNPVLATNVVFLAILTANGWAATRLARHLGAAAGPAVLVGVLAQATPFVATQMGVLQL